MNQVL